MSRCVFRQGDVFERLAELPDNSVDLIVTSPPFLALRSYLPADHPDKGKEIGSEATPAAFISTLLALTREWRRILAPHGSIAVELGDTYSGSGGENHLYDSGFSGGKYQDPATVKNYPGSGRRNMSRGWPLAKSLCLLPSLYPASLAYGHNLLAPADLIDPWRIRNLIVWHRPNPPVGALGDKVRPSTSHVTVACTSTKRWFDLDAERQIHIDSRGRSSVSRGGETLSNTKAGVSGSNAFGRNVTVRTFDPAGAPPLDCWIDTTDSDVWTIPTQPYAGSHYATFPIALPRKLINLMCPRSVCVTCGEPRRRIVGEAEYHQSPNAHGSGLAVDDVAARTWVSGISAGKSQSADKRDGGRVRTAPTLGWSDCGHDNYRRGVVCDPFAGSGTTLAAAAELGRDAIGIDLDDRNWDLARERIGLFLDQDDIPA